MPKEKLEDLIAAHLYQIREANEFNEDIRNMKIGNLPNIVSIRVEIAKEQEVETRKYNA